MTTAPLWLQVVAALGVVCFAVAIAGAVRDEIHDWRRRSAELAEEAAQRAELAHLESLYRLPSTDPRIHVICPQHGEICVVGSPSLASGEMTLHRILEHGESV
jgi:hypothetical protein